MLALTLPTQMEHRGLRELKMFIVNKAPTTTGESPFAITIGGTPYLVYPFRVMQAGTSTPLLL